MRAASSRTVFQRYQRVLDDPHSSGKGRDNHGGPLMMAAVCRPGAASENGKTSGETTGEGAVSRDGFIHQSQDQGIDAVRPGAGRDDEDQHKGIKRLR